MVTVCNKSCPKISYLKSCVDLGFNTGVGREPQETVAPGTAVNCLEVWCADKMGRKVVSEILEDEGTCGL